MATSTPRAGNGEPSDGPHSQQYARSDRPRLILVTGTAIDDQTLRNLLHTRDFAAVIPLGANETHASSSVWERFADRPELVPHTPFKLLSLMLEARRNNLKATDDDALAYEALALARDKPSRFLNSLNKGSQDDAGIGVGPLQFPLKALAIPLRWIVFGAARSRLLKLTTVDGQWDLKSARQAAQQLPEDGAASNRIAERARSELASIYRRSFIADCAVGGIELVFAGIADGDEAYELAAALKAESRRARGQLHYYEHHDPGQSVRTGELVGLLRELRTGPSKFAEWHHFGATGLPDAEKPLPTEKSRVRAAMSWTAASLVLVLLITLAVLWNRGTFEQDPCGEPFERDEAGGECLRLSEGANCVNPELIPACQAIARQNEAIGADEDYFTIAVALSMTFEGDDANSPADIANQIQGAAAAQALINESQSPKVRLLLTDLGSSNSEWDEAAEALLERRTEENLIAVAGLSASYEATKLFIDRMNREGLVVMGSTITGDNMLTGSEETNSAFRMGPTNTQEAVALASFVREHGDLCSVFNVSDTDRSYDYAITLNEAFQAQQAAEGCTDSPRPFTYNGSNISEVNPSLFNETVAAMCEEVQQDSYLFFAGLSRFALPSLIRSLTLRKGPCLEHRITIVTGDNASSVPRDRSLVADLRAANVELYYIGLAHPDQWDEAGPEHQSSAEQMKSAEDQLLHQFGTDANLANGQALMSYEAFRLTAIVAQGQGPTVTADSLADELRDFSGITATGPIEFDGQGNPVSKTMTMLAARTDVEDPVEVIALITS
ncbi:ABC transporter substrate-binding protein [Glycomyces rhizosphaerae]|uniref:ABC transporter substrate-binding protein n=1 Tax=Glycomyces rhizosphaerae TaxID=2054422 RepID=A0ABV7Q337_9ACTN